MKKLEEPPYSVKMSKKRTLLFLTLILWLGVFLIWISQRQSKNLSTPLFKSGEVTLLEIHFEKKSLSFEKYNGNWKITDYDGKKPLDTRANQNLIEHLLDFLKTANKSSETYPHKEANKYGMTNPQLVVSLKWLHPQIGEEALFFGNVELSEKNVFVFLPKQMLLTKTSSQILELFRNKSPLDLRERKITTFETDDVEELKTQGKCKAMHLIRDGDRWVWKTKPPIDVAKTNQWLDELLGIAYYDIDEENKIDLKKPHCILELLGRKNRKETLSISLDLWIKNSQLPANYRVPSTFSKIIY